MPTPTLANHSSNDDAQFHVQRAGTTATLTITGLLTGPHVQSLREMLEWLSTQGLSAVTINLDVSAGVGAAVLRLLRLSRSKLRGQGGDLVARSADPNIMEMLALIGLGEHNAANAAEGHRTR
ncbi:anti-anti-sigma regulatory factor [Antricoccus suffuscus]|uniref:Anti-anti-sigma regulatory factor n=1 Tax=Antricoccus suffuscus TaxID=1629062 RepID=A0A2T1A642_9ACTN|nr:STAS domain-containing protein [Antricoccus suffuscus]PRZ44082.1 anti-anti-sigma regulatory factor [Antricoccus suffuscus]